MSAENYPIMIQVVICFNS